MLFIQIINQNIKENQLILDEKNNKVNFKYKHRTKEKINVRFFLQSIKNRCSCDKNIH